MPSTTSGFNHHKGQSNVITASENAQIFYNVMEPTRGFNRQKKTAMEVMEAMDVNNLLELPGGVLCRILSFSTAATLAKLRKCFRGVL